jgi:hypothetical protein
LIAAQFAGDASYKAYIEVLNALGAGKGQKLFEFGCSWGYGSWQLSHFGFEVQAYEISTSRAAYAREMLGVDVVDSMTKANKPYDIFFSSHVLEHVPSVEQTLSSALELLREGGLFVAFTPNGCAARRGTDPRGWHQQWGLVHPQMLDDVYYAKRFKGYASVMDSSPYKLDNLKEWSRTGLAAHREDLGGNELFFAARI